MARNLRQQFQKLSDIGKIKTFEKEVNLNADKKRFWFEDLTDINEKKMNELMPISFNPFSKNEI
jgi:transposase